MRISIFLSTLLLLIGLAASYVILSWDSEGFPVSEKASTLISLWTCVAAFISIVFVIRSYLQTNQAFVLSQKPHLRIWVGNETIRTSGQENATANVTVINYQNMTLNPFLDLTINVAVRNARTTVDLSDLFKPAMFMAGHDQRARRFTTKKELSARGFDLSSDAMQQDPVLLCISYKFTFGGKAETTQIQRYRWDASLSQWSLE